MGTDAAGNQVSYVIHRLCEQALSDRRALNKCMRSSAGSGTASDDGTKASWPTAPRALPGTSTVYYRVTVRIVGPRNTVSYVQAVLN
jgi:hypothetical protein